MLFHETVTSLFMSNISEINNLLDFGEITINVYSYKAKTVRLGIALRTYCER